MQYFTIVIEHASITVREGVLAKSRLVFHAPDHCWYQLNACGCKLTATKKDSIAHAVLTHAISRHIPAISLRKFSKP